MAPHWRVVRHPAVESKHKMPESISHENEIDSGTQARTYDRPGRYTVAVKVIDIFGNDTMTLVPVNVG